MRMHAKMCLLTGVLWATSAVAQAMDLKQVYEKALRNDPQYLAARQDMMALAEVYPQAWRSCCPMWGSMPAATRST